MIFKYFDKMKLIFRMESVLIAIICILCLIVLFKLLYKLRSTLPWRVNCWFCNNNFTVKFPERNSWTCPKCEQYNGFTKDGDYNKPLFSTSEQALRCPKVFHSSSPKNGLCKMCNINQQLKVAQLANFVPMNEKTYEQEIESYRMQLEKAYKLCNSCKRTVQLKLHKEKETLLGHKQLESRIQNQSLHRIKTENQRLKIFINKTSMIIAGSLLVVLVLECYRNIMENKNLIPVINLKEILSGLIERMTSIVKTKTLCKFPFLEHYLSDMKVLYFDVLTKGLEIDYKYLPKLTFLSQKALGGLACLVQIIGHVWNVNSLQSSIAIDLLWTLFLIGTMSQQYVDIDPAILSLVKLASVLAVILVYRSLKTETVRPATRYPTIQKRMNLSNKSINSMIDNEDISMDTDDDVSLSKFGLHNFSDSSNDTISPLNNSLISGRAFTPRKSDLWTKPKLNSNFCVNSVHCKSPSSVSDTVFVKPTFNKYQHLEKDESDSDLDESISSLCISSPKKSKKSSSSIFSLHKFKATPNFVAPTPLSRSRPLISPSKLGHGTSWVAGGYWGADTERAPFSVDGSRSSSQSSGFESQASSVNRNVFSQPPSREESVCGEPDRTSVLLDRFQSCSTGGLQSPQNFSRMSSPIFPQMQYNGHVHIPQARFASQPANNGHVHIPQARFASQGVFANHCARASIFKAPGGPGLIKLPK